MNFNPTQLVTRSRLVTQRKRFMAIASFCFVLVLQINSCHVRAFQPRNIFAKKCSRSHNWNSFSPIRPASTIFEYVTPHHNLRKISSLHVSNNDEVSTTLAINTEISSVEKKTNEKIYQTAIKRTLLSVAAASLFGLSIFHWMGPESGEEFFAGYLVEQSLSVDNLFVFLLLFDYFKVPMPYQNRVLNYGIIGAVIMRAVVIALGSAVLHRFKPVLLVFASILIFSSYTSLVETFGEGDKEEEDQDMGENAIVKFSKSLLPTTDMYDRDNFFTSLDGGVKKATPLLLCLVAVEISDIVFAVDSIPAVFGVTEDSFIVFTSNMFAILGLRSLYTVLSKAAADLEYLEPAVAIVLGFIGSKMVAEFFGYCLPTSIALIVVATLLGGGIGLSLLNSSSDASGVEINDVEDVIS